MSQFPIWASPGEASDMMFDVRQPGVTGLGYALLRPRSKKGQERSVGQDRSMSRLAYAKMNPIKPGPTSARTRCGMQTTARYYRLLLAPGVADPMSLNKLLADYDEAVPEHQRLLAAVLTLPFKRYEPLHDQFDKATTWAMLHLARARQLTSLAVLHAPGDQLCLENPHAHLVVFGRIHQVCGWGAVHPDLTESAHGAWAERWLDFCEAWCRKPEV